MEKWYNEAVFYHMYPLGMTGAPKKNEYVDPVHRLGDLKPWVDHIKKLGFTALYIGPLFESEGHGYETTDYYKVDSRLGDNNDLKEFVKYCHDTGIRVVLDGVFNHTGRTFFAFQDIMKNREGSRYVGWYNINFWGNTEYNDGFSYDNWGGYNLLVKLNQNNPEVRSYIIDAVKFWISEFDIDGIRLDAADVLNFDFMKELRWVTSQAKEDFWLMGEVIHGDYSRWANNETLHSVTNYTLHKGLYSGHNDHNYFEIAHTVKRLNEMGCYGPDRPCLYNFVDNHDVARIASKLNNKAHFYPVHMLMYTLPGVPSVYYGSEFGIEGNKEKGSDDSLRPDLVHSDLLAGAGDNEYVKFIGRLGKIRNSVKALSYGDYRECLLTNRQYAFQRTYGELRAVVVVNNDDNQSTQWLRSVWDGEYTGLLYGGRAICSNGNMEVTIPANSGEIFVPVDQVPKECESENQEPVTIDNSAGEPANKSAYLFGQILGTHSFYMKDGFPVADEYSEIAGKYFLPGGETGSAATVLASLGVNVKIDGTHIGTEVAPMLKKFYSDKNVDLSSVYFDPDYEGLMDYVIISGFDRTPMGTFQALYESGIKRWNMPKESDILGASVVAIDPFFGDESRAAAELCVKHGKPYVTIDCKHDTYLHQHATINIVSKECLGADYRDMSKEEAMEILKENAEGLTIITTGSNDMLYARKGEQTKRMNTFKVDVKSTLGAGDTFKAGCVYGLLNGLGDDELVKTAAACSAIAISRYPLPLFPPRLEEVTELTNL